MSEVKVKLTVFFEVPFWVGVYEYHYDNISETAKVVFGEMPKDAEILSMVLSRHPLAWYLEKQDRKVQQRKRINPKRRQRKATQEIKNGIGKKSWQALSKQREMLKKQVKQSSRAAKRQKAAYQFALKEKKRREKHRGH